MAISPKFTQRHYEAIAAVAEKFSVSRDHDVEAAPWATITALPEFLLGLARLFEIDNKNFDKRKFLKAAGFEWCVVEVAVEEEGVDQALDGDWQAGDQVGDVEFVPTKWDRKGW